MRWIFWICFALTGYAYLGYPVCLACFARKRPFRRGAATPGVSILIAARNEQDRLPAKLSNLAELDYPADRLQILIASDGSTDRTAAILAEHAPAVQPVLLPVSAGKAAALHQAADLATGEILVFLDVRQRVEPDALRALVAPFADPAVGAVSGELLLASADGGGDALGLYWRIEKAVRRLESASGSVVGVTGAIYAVRRELYTGSPPGTILDDVFVPMQVARAGKRVVFEPAAIARDRIFAEPGKEFSRKVRTLTGNYQLLRIAPWLLTPRNPLLFRFVSHKLARLLVPLWLVLMLLAAGLGSGLPWHTLFALQLVFYALATLGLALPAARRLKPVAVATTFLMLNAAAALAFYNFIAGRKNVWA